VFICEKEVDTIKHNMISNGKEAVTVYKIKASAAGVRSG
jgi:hypothetical protein